MIFHNITVFTVFLIKKNILNSSVCWDYDSVFYLIYFCVNLILVQPSKNSLHHCDSFCFPEFMFVFR